ncbi:MAG: UDP-3-O-(3-hydroxymyristoyl)glucosamine N-acyltransferase [Litorimonas sp.]
MIDPRFYTLSPPMRLNDLLSVLGLDAIEGTYGDEIINAPTALAGSRPHDMCFLANKRRAKSLDNAKATICFVTEKLAHLVSEKRIIPIISKSPRAAFARASQHLVAIRKDQANSLIHPSAKISSSANVHPTALIGADVVIGDEAIIGPYAVIDRGVEIGTNTHIGSHSQISFSIIGKNCHIKTGAVIGGMGFGVAKDETGLIDIPHFGRVMIGERVNIGSQSCIDRGQLGDTVLGDDVKIDNLVQIAHNVRIGRGTMMAGLVGISGSCVIGENCQLGGRVGLADHVTIGDGAILTASSGVAQNVPAGEMWGGTPALPFREHMRIFAATRKLARRPTQHKASPKPENN